jgi:putative PIN family toxin of toxin-antitoxin system
MNVGSKVVFDCNVFLQALSSPRGPAGRCLQLVIEGKLSLFISPLVSEELREVTSRPSVIRKMRLTAESVEALFAALELVAILISGFPETFVYDRDPDDAHYVNLALAAGAQLVVSRDRDLLDLMDPAKPGAVQFQRDYPAIRILDPTALLDEIGT